MSESTAPSTSTAYWLTSALFLKSISGLSTLPGALTALANNTCLSTTPDCFSALDTMGEVRERGSLSNTDKRNLAMSLTGIVITASGSNVYALVYTSLSGCFVVYDFLAANPRAPIKSAIPKFVSSALDIAATSGVFGVLQDPIIVAAFLKNMYGIATSSTTQTIRQSAMQFCSSALVACGNCSTDSVSVALTTASQTLSNGLWNSYLTLFPSTVTNDPNVASIV